jgi:glycosyltransferase involved in cell wall biosynthesis
LGLLGDEMKKKVLVRGPVLSQSGYGVQSRFALRSLRHYEDSRFDIYIIPVGWGRTNWISDDTEERKWIDERIRQTGIYASQGGQFDISLQITIPHEWEPLAPINIGYTAGVETTRVSALWLEKCNIMDRIIAISNHTKWGLENTSYTGVDPRTNSEVTLKCNTPIDVVNYPIRTYDSVDLDLNFEYNFNYLLVAQWGPRKNVENTIRWFIEENYDQEVGLVIKTFSMKNCLMDRNYTAGRLRNILNEYNDGERKCKIYLMHGDMTNEEMTGLYRHPKIKALISLSHGEGFGLPIFEAAYNELPIITTDWGGQCDFLYAPDKGRNKKAMFSKVKYTIAPIQQEVLWENVLIEDAQWCFPEAGSFKMKLREVRNNYKKYKSMAKKLCKHVNVEFAPEKQYEKFANSVCGPEFLEMESWLTELENEEQVFE